VEETQALAELARAAEGFVPSCRQSIQQLGHSFDQAPSEAPAKLRLHQLRQDIQVLADRQLEKLPPCLDAHGEQALR
jgi:hypothetical protein